MSKYVEVEIDLTDYEDDIKDYYCNCDRCLAEKESIDKIRDYVVELDKDLHLRLRPCTKRTAETICYDLMQLVKEG